MFCRSLDLDLSWTENRTGPDRTRPHRRRTYLSAGPQTPFGQRTNLSLLANTQMSLGRDTQCLLAETHTCLWAKSPRHTHVFRPRTTQMYLSQDTHVFRPGHTQCLLAKTHMSSGRDTNVSWLEHTCLKTKKSTCHFLANSADRPRI